MLNWPEFNLPPINLWSAPKMIEEYALVEQLKIWKRDATERIIENEQLIDEQKQMMARMHIVIVQLNNALDEAKKIVQQYIEFKSEWPGSGMV